MWCYQKPGFESLLISELQRQQQRSQFCDTMLKAEDVSVPAHSFVLSAISPHVAFALSSAPVLPAGQCHLLEFPALGGRTLRRMVELLYSGEMAGEGEKEKQEAISAAAKLGIHGLVEVTRRGGGGGGGGGRQVEMGIQTEPLMQEDNEGRRVRWRREVRSEDTLLWKETLCSGGEDVGTQTEELQVNTAPTAESAALTETIDMSVLQVVEETDYQFISSQIPHIPISLLYGPENQISPLPSAPAQPMQSSTLAGHTSRAYATRQYTSLAPPPRPYSSVCVTPQAAASKSTEAEEWQDEEFEQFQGNIPGFINYFLNSDKDSGTQRGRPRGRRRGRRRGRPRGRPRGEPRGETGNTRGRAGRPRESRGGRARGKLTQMVDVQNVGVSKVQKMYLQRLGRRSTSTGQGGGAAGRKLSLMSRELLKSSESRRNRRGSAKVWETILTTGEKKTPRQQFKQEGLPGSRTTRAKSTASYSSSPAPCHLFSSPHPQPSPSSFFLSPAASLLHTTSLPPPDPPPQEEQPEQFERLVDEVMRELNILPNTSSAPTSSRPCATDRSCHGSAVQACTSISAEGDFLQQQGEGELENMLDRYLQSFEQHFEASLPREEGDLNGVHGSEPLSPLLSQDEDAGTTWRSQPHKAPAEGRLRKVRAQRKEHKRKTSPQSLEKEPAVKSRAVTPPDLRDKLLQFPVVKLVKGGLMLQEPCGQDKSSAKGKGRSSSEHHCCDLTKKIHPELQSKKDYPFRKRLRNAYKPNVDTSIQLRPRRNRQNTSSPADYWRCGEPENQEEAPQEVESTTRRRKRRRAECEVETSDDAPAARRVYMDQQAKQVSPSSCAHASKYVQLASEPADAQAEEMIDVELVSPNDRGAARLEREEINVSQAEERSRDEAVGSSGDETIDLIIDGDTRHDPDHCGGLEERGRSVPFESQSVKDGGSSDDDDIDVIGGCSPSPEPVVISWTESSGNDEEDDEADDIDVVGGYASSAILSVRGANWGHNPARALQRGALNRHVAAHEVLLLKMTGELLS